MTKGWQERVSFLSGLIRWLSAALVLIRHLLFVICHVRWVIVADAGDRKICGYRWGCPGHRRRIALEISHVVWLARALTRRYFDQKRELRVLLPDRYLHSPQYRADRRCLDFAAVTALRE
jgi:hypothetical protein